MHPFSQAVLERFPELLEKWYFGDEDLPYLVARNLVDWLAREVKHPLSTEMVRRVLGFYDWCRSQPEC